MNAHVVGSSYDGFPLFRMNSDTVKYWLIGGALRRELANTIAKTWRTGVVVLSPTLYAIGIVRPDGSTEDLRPPFRSYHMWQIANKPSAKYGECACRNYYDPEVGGPWSMRERERGLDIHHPHCQFERTATAGWTQAYRSATARQDQGLNPQARPDEWVRTRQELSQ